MEFSKSVQDKVIGTKNEVATIYDISTGDRIRELRSGNSNNYMRNKATFDPTDDLVLNDGVLYDMRMGSEIRKLDKLNPNLSGVFNPNGLEIVSNSEVWDLRTFHLLKTVPGLDQHEVIFSKSGEIIYAIHLGQEDEDDEKYDSAFKTFDATDYSNIGKRQKIFEVYSALEKSLLSILATIETRRGVLGLASSRHDLQIAVVENSLAPTVHEESVVRLYDVGRLRADEEDDEDDEDDDVGAEDQESEQGGE